MKIYLASFLQPENFGPGRIIGICHGNKPRDVKVDTVFLPVTPSLEIIEEYNHTRTKHPKEASECFVKNYSEQLERFVQSVREAAQEDSCTVQEILPFEDGITLASWERAEFTNYRKILAPFLMDLGYEVVLN
jgi:hypothetical protein